MIAREKLHILVITSLYPNSANERHGIFVETRLRKILEREEVTAEVVAPVPWLPPFLGRAKRYAQYKGIPREETRFGIKVYHPRYVVIPRIGMLFTPFLMALSIWLCIRRLGKQGKKFSLVDAHYYYPDGVAVAIACSILKLPFTVTARGTDINLIADKRLPRKMILMAARRASASITVSSALRKKMIELGAEPNKIHVLRNGVDLEFFRPMNREVCKARFSSRSLTLLSVGNLIELKGHHLVIEALQELQDFKLLIAGDGEMREELETLAVHKGVSDRVRFLGTLTQKELRHAYNAADIFILASSREGLANVLLESMACGTPVVATNVGGAPEIVRSSEAGLLVDERTASAITVQVTKLMAALPDRRATRNYAKRFSWDSTVANCHSLFRQVADA